MNPVKFTRNPSSDYLKAMEALANLARKEGLDAIDRAYAEVAAAYRESEFAKEYGVNRSRAAAWVGRLVNRKPKAPSCHHEPMSPPGRDHPIVWLRNGRPALYLSQPYSITLKNMRELIAYCDAWNLDAVVRADLSIWFPSRTMAVVIQQKKETPKDAGTGD